MHTWSDGLQKNTKIKNVHIQTFKGFSKKWKKVLPVDYSYLVVRKVDTVAKNHWDVPIVDTIVFLIHPLIKDICVHNPAGVHLQKAKHPASNFGSMWKKKKKSIHIYPPTHILSPKFFHICDLFCLPAMSSLQLVALQLLLPHRLRTANCHNCCSKEETRVNNCRTQVCILACMHHCYVTCQDACPSEPECVGLSALQDASIRLKVGMGEIRVFSQYQV